MTYRKIALNSLLFDLKWFIKYFFAGKGADSRWYWAAVKTSFSNLWRQRGNKRIAITNDGINKIIY